jgi:hypothetical protein
MLGFESESSVPWNDYERRGGSFMATDTRALTPILRARQAAQRAWEWQQAGRATVGTIPIVFLCLAMLAISGRAVQISTIGAGLVVAVWLSLFLGREFRRGVLPGIAAGIFPLVMATTAEMVGHSCSAEGCVSWCVPACIAGGVTGGALLSWSARRREWPLSQLLVGGWVSILCGALGCSCVGYSGIVGMVAGLAIPTAPVLIRYAFRPAAAT